MGNASTGGNAYVPLSSAPGTVLGNTSGSTAVPSSISLQSIISPPTAETGYNIGSSFKPSVFMRSLLTPKEVLTDGLLSVDAIGNPIYGPYANRILANAALQFYWRFTEISGPTGLTPSIVDSKGGNALAPSGVNVASYQQPGLLPGGGLGRVTPIGLANPDPDPSFFFNGGFFQAATAIWVPSATTPWTVMFAVRPNVTRSGGVVGYTIWSNRDSANHFGGIAISLRWNGSTKTVLQVDMASITVNADFNQVQGTTDLANATVYFVAVSYNGSSGSTNNGFSVQINGNIETLTNTSALLGADSCVTTIPVQIGRQTVSSPSLMKGNLDELAVFTAVQTTSEIAYLHALGMGVPQITPLSYPISVVYDNDCADDSGNVQGYALLHKAANAGLVNIQAMTVVDTYNFSAAVVQAINNYYGRGSIPLGANQSSPISTNHFTAQTIATNFGTSAYTLASFGTAGNTPVPILRRALAANAAAGTKTVLVATGFLTNIAALLASPADSISALTGSQLITAAVSQLVLGAGRWPSNVLNAISAPEFNIATDIAASQAVLNGTNWPTPIVLVGVEMGDNAGAGPLTTASAYYNAAVNINQAIWAAATDLTVGFRQLWDALPILYLMGGIGTVFDYGGLNGTIAIDGSGNNVWSATPGNASYLRMKLTNPQLANLVTTLFSTS